jgi:O-antigen biosynthesis protein
VPAKLLVNGNTIKQLDHIESLETFHIELSTHDILLAEGTLAESYAETNNRSKFHNAQEFVALYPDDKALSFQFCAPRIEEGSPELARIRTRLFSVEEERRAA